MGEIRKFSATELKSSRVLLRGLTEMDVVEIYNACNDYEIQKWIPLQSPYELNHAHNFVKEYAVGQLEGGKGIVFAIEVDQKFVGVIDIFNTNWTSRICEIGYWIVLNFRANGYATEAVDLLASWVIEQQGFQRVEILIATDNFASQKVVERAKFQKEGVCRNKMLNRNRNIDVIMYSRIP